MVLGGADSEAGYTFLKFWPQHSFLGKFGLKKSKLSVFPENRHKWYFGRGDSESGVTFSKFWSQNQFWGKFGQKK